MLSILSFIVRETQVKTTMGCYFMAVRRALTKIKFKKLTSVGECVEKLEPTLEQGWWECKTVQQSTTHSMAIPQRRKHRITV